MASKKETAYLMRCPSYHKNRKTQGVKKKNANSFYIKIMQKFCESSMYLTCLVFVCWFLAHCVWVNFITTSGSIFSIWCELFHQVMKLSTSSISNSKEFAIKFAASWKVSSIIHCFILYFSFSVRDEYQGGGSSEC